DNAKHAPRAVAEERPAALAASHTTLDGPFHVLPRLLRAPRLLLAPYRMASSRLGAETDKPFQGGLRSRHTPPRVFHQGKGCAGQPFVPFVSHLFSGGGQGTAKATPAPFFQRAAVAGIDPFVRLATAHEFPDAAHGLPGPGRRIFQRD